MLTERELFQKAFALVSNPETWNNKGDYARDKDGKCVSRFGAEAVRFCSLGALDRCIGEENWYTGGPEARAERRIEAKLNTASRNSIARFNDTHTHEEVVALWKKVGEENGWLDPQAVSSQ